jgi:group I intron endonuclease
MVVYVITNTVNGKRYVGIATGITPEEALKRRWFEHSKAARDAPQALYRAMRKHGVENFTVEQIDQAETLEELLEKERHYIQLLGTFTNTGHGYNMTLGGDGVFGFEFDEESKAVMAASAVARFADPVERELQSQRQERFWTESNRAEHSEKIARVHERNPDLARQHSEFMKKNSDPERMRKNARLAWDTPEIREQMLHSSAEYWSDPAKREKRGKEIRQRLADNPDYAKNISKAKKKLYRERPELAQRHSQMMKQRFAENPALLDEMREQTTRADARRRALRDELTSLAVEYQAQTGETFAIPKRSEGGWQTAVMVELITRLKPLLKKDVPQGGETYCGADALL